MKVSELKYERVTIEHLREEFGAILAAVRGAKTVDEVLAARKRMLDVLCDYSTNSYIASNRYSLNMADEFYSAEHDYYDEINPEAESMMYEYRKAMLETPLRGELEKVLSPVLYKKEIKRREK